MIYSRLCGWETETLWHQPPKLKFDLWQNRLLAWCVATCVGVLAWCAVIISGNYYQVALSMGYLLPTPDIQIINYVSNFSSFFSSGSGQSSESEFLFFYFHYFHIESTSTSTFTSPSPHPHPHPHRESRFNVFNRFYISTFLHLHLATFTWSVFYRVFYRYIDIQPVHWPVAIPQHSTTFNFE